MAIVRRENMYDLPHGYMWPNKEQRSGHRWHFCVDGAKGTRDECAEWLAEHCIKQSYIRGMGGEISMYFFDDEEDAVMFYLRWC
jgi:hypothetical protein